MMVSPAERAGPCVGRRRRHNAGHVGCPVPDPQGVHHMAGRIVGWWKPALGLVVALGLACAAERLRGAQPSQYPRVNVATGYAVDSAWPRKPSTARWEAVSGI